MRRKKSPLMGGGDKTARPEGGSEAHLYRAKPSRRPRDAESAGAGRESADTGRNKERAQAKHEGAQGRKAQAQANTYKHRAKRTPKRRAEERRPKTAFPPFWASKKSASEAIRRFSTDFLGFMPRRRPPSAKGFEA